MGIKLITSDEKMLEAIERLKDLGLAESQREVCETIGIEPQRISKIRSGKQHFIAENIRLMAKEFNVNLNFIFGFSDEFFAKKKVSKNVNIELISALNHSQTNSATSTTTAL